MKFRIIGAVVVLLVVIVLYVLSSSSSSNEGVANEEGQTETQSQ